MCSIHGNVFKPSKKGNLKDLWPKKKKKITLVLCLLPVTQSKYIKLLFIILLLNFHGKYVLDIIFSQSPSSSSLDMILFNQCPQVAKNTVYLTGATHLRCAYCAVKHITEPCLNFQLYIYQPTYTDAHNLAPTLLHIQYREICSHQHPQMGDLLT